MKRKASAILLVLFISLIFYNYAMAGGVNYGTSTETLQFIYEGYVQCQPSYNDGGYNAARAYLRYQNGIGGDTGRLYTSYGYSATDSNIYSRSHTYYDTLNPFADPVIFNYGFDYVPVGIGVWPV